LTLASIHRSACRRMPANWQHRKVSWSWQDFAGTL